MKATTASAEENLGVALGAVLVGKYRIDAILGQGGMGVVARATHLHLNETVSRSAPRPSATTSRAATASSPA